MPKKVSIPELLVIPFHLDHRLLVEQYLRGENATAMEQSAKAHVPVGAPIIRWLNETGEGLSIEDVRSLTYELSYGLSSSQSHIFVLLHFETASLAAQNALLKTLEEPPAGAQILITMVEGGTILPTIASRCQTATAHLPLIEAAVTEASSAAEEMWESVRTARSHATLIDLGEKVKERTDGILLIRSLITLLYAKYIRRSELPAPPPTVQQVRVVLERLHTCLRQLEANVNVRLALETCFFDMYSALQP